MSSINNNINTFINNYDPTNNSKVLVKSKDGLIQSKTAKEAENKEFEKLNPFDFIETNVDKFTPEQREQLIGKLKSEKGSPKVLHLIEKLMPSILSPQESMKTDIVKKLVAKPQIDTGETKIMEMILKHIIDLLPPELIKNWTLKDNVGELELTTPVEIWVKGGFGSMVLNKKMTFLFGEKTTEEGTLKSLELRPGNVKIKAGLISGGFSGNIAFNTKNHRATGAGTIGSGFLSVNQKGSIHLPNLLRLTPTEIEYKKTTF